MDYYILVNGQKQGPYDVLDFIKKVKNGVITAETQVSTTENGPYMPAGGVEELKEIIKAESGHASSISKDVSLSLNATLNESAELWTRRVTEYTLFFAAIIVVGFGISMGLKKIQLFADYPFVTNYITATLTYTLLGFYCYYVLMTKRSQDPDLKEIKSLMKLSLSNLLIFAAIISLAIIPLGVNILISTITLSIATIVLSLLIFVPFLIVDHRMGMRRAVVVSLESFKSLSASVIFTIIIIVAVNIAAVLLPSVLGNIIFFLVLLISLPVSIAILANIYDHILA